MDFENFENYLFGYVNCLWNNKKFILITCLISVLLSIVFWLGTPSVYTSTVSIVPESNMGNNYNASAMASLLGVGGSVQELDAVNIGMAPNILNSTPFVLELFKDSVSTVDGESMLLPEYVDSQRASLLGFFLSIPGQMIGFVRNALSGFPDGQKSYDVNPFKLTKKQFSMVAKIRNSITIENKSGVTRISVTFQDPLVAATVANIVTDRLRDYVVEYKTEKAVNNFNYISEMCDQAQKEYYQAQKEYAEYVDTHSSVILKSAMIEQERLQNEMNLKYRVFSELASQVPVAKNKIQEAKPLYTILEPASVPVNADNLGLKMLLVIFVILGLIVSSAWVLFGKPFVNDVRKYHFHAEDAPES